MSKYYRGMVVSTDDPDNCGQVQVYIPAIHKEFNSSYCYPWAICGLYCQEGSIVIVGFEDGEVNAPMVISVVTGGINEAYNSGTLTVSGSKSSSSASSVSGTVNELALWLAAYHETNHSYDLAITDSDGYLSIGLIMWHTDNAKKLVDRIKSEYPSDYNAACKEFPMVSLPTGSWSKFRPTTNQYKLLSAIIDTAGGHKVQDKMGAEYMQDYIEACVNTGIKNPACIVYYCDFATQSPGYAKKWAQTCYSNGWTTIDDFHSYWRGQSSDAKRPRRDDSYKYVKLWISQGKLKDVQPQE